MRGYGFPAKKNYQNDLLFRNEAKSIFDEKVMGKIFLFGIFFSSFSYGDLDKCLSVLNEKELFYLSRNGPVSYLFEEVMKVGKLHPGLFLNLWKFPEIPIERKSLLAYEGKKLNPSDSNFPIRNEMNVVGISKVVLKAIGEFGVCLASTGVSEFEKENLYKRVDQLLSGKGKYLWGFKYTEEERSKFFEVYLSSEKSKKILQAFSDKNHFYIDGRITRKKEIEKKLFKEFSENELVEMLSIKEASEVFYKNSLFRLCPGGWKNNADIESKNFVALCREHSETTYHFLRNLERSNLMKHFKVDNYIVLNLKDARTHASVIIKSRRNQRMLVVDSWRSELGSSFKIVRFEDFLLPTYGVDIFENRCDDSLREQ